MGGGALDPPSFFMTLSELKTEVFRRLDESQASPVYFSDLDVETSLNEGYETISEASEWYEDSAAINLLDETYYNLKALIGERFLRVTRVWNPQINVWLVPTSPRELDTRGFARWEKVTGQPRMWFVRGLWHLGLYPKVPVAGGTVKVYYKALPNPLTGDNDVPGFEEEYHLGLVDYAIYDLLAQTGETQKALGYYDSYLVVERALTAHASNRMRVDKLGVFGG